MPRHALGVTMLLLLVGCAQQNLVFSPDALDFGEVDFSGELPDEGYATETVTLTNEGKSPVAISLPEYDLDRLCLQGFGSQEFPVDLGELAPGASYTFVVGVCAYLPGEVDTEVATQLDVDTDGDPGTVTLPITFTPVRTSD